MSVEEPQLESRTKLPTELDQEDPLIILSEFHITLRQTLTILLGLVSWMIASRMTTAVLPISGVFAGLLWSWLAIACLFLAFVKKDGEPYEQYLSEKIEFWLSNRRFINISNEGQGDIEDADWDSIEDGFYVDSD